MVKAQRYFGDIHAVSDFMFWVHMGTLAAIGGLLIAKLCIAIETAIDR